MTTTILGILAALIPFGIWLYKRRAERKADPEQQRIERHETANKDLVDRDAETASAHGLADLDALERLQNRPDHPQ